METIIIAVAFALICMVMAERRGRNKWLGFASGLLFGVITIIYYWIVGDTKELRFEKVKLLIKKGVK